ncbi:hypothetical protein L3Q67_41385 [Saccharothrix sp. AJ9571]|nr:hypothetical protein L3Q67_41385 [Saccharothrix sp. AJ9571]
MSETMVTAIEPPRVLLSGQQQKGYPASVRSRGLAVPAFPAMCCRCHRQLFVRWTGTDRDENGVEQSRTRSSRRAMTIGTRPAEDVVSRITHELSTEFGTTLPESGICDVVVTARRDLDGQIVPEAMEEMLHRLARFRLTRWIGSG